MAVNDFVGFVLFGDGRCRAEVRTIRVFERISPILLVSVPDVDEPLDKAFRPTFAAGVP